MRPIRFAVTGTLLVATAFPVGCGVADSSSPSSRLPDEPFTVTLSPRLDTLVVGATLRLTARAHDRFNTTRVATIEWRAADPTVASVSAAGWVTALSEGRARVIAGAGGIPDTAIVVVLGSASPLSISPSAMSVILGDSLQLSASMSPAAGSAASLTGIRWLTSDSTVATVSEQGLVVARDSGSATISASLNDATASATVQVVQSPVTSVTVSPGNSTIFPGQTQQLSAVARDASGRLVLRKSVKWSSSEPKIAVVAGAGSVAGVGKGIANITAQVQGRQGTATVNVLGVPVATVSVTLARTELGPGQTTQASAALVDEQGDALAGRVVAWQSSNPAIATVNASGTVTAVAIGSAKISAISEGKVGSASLAVHAPVPTRIEIAPSTIAISVGSGMQLMAQVRDASGAVMPNRPITWSTTDTAVAAVAPAGWLTGVAPGSAEVRASADGLAASALVAVAQVRAASVIVSPASVALSIGDTASLAATVRDASQTPLPGRTVDWASSNTSVATVSPDGSVMAVGVGNAAVTARVDGLTATGAVDVSAPPSAPVASVAVSLSSSSLDAGQTAQATVISRDAAGNLVTGKASAWSSTNVDVATVSSSGLVAAVSAGSASIIAAVDGQAGAATLTVAAPIPAPVATVSLSATSASLFVGQSIRITARLTDASGRVLENRTIGWTSSSTAVATVSPTGLATAVGAGTVSITAVSEGKSGFLVVSVMPPSVGGGACGLVTDLTPRAVATLAKPGYLRSAVDPAFGTTLVRVSGDPGTPIGNGVNGTWGQIARHAYAKQQAWSADGRLLMLREMAGAVGGGMALFLDGETYQPLFTGGPAPEFRWHATVPDVVIGVRSDGSVVFWNARTKATAVKVAVSGYSAATMGEYEGNASDDGRYVPVVATRGSDGRRVAFVANTEVGTKSADLDLAAQGLTFLDWFSISPSGRYVVLLGAFNGVPQLSKVYDRATLQLVAFWQDHPLGHADLGRDVTGNDVAFGAAAGGPYLKRFVARRLDNGQVTPLTPATSYDWHASTRNTARPGWGYAVTNDATGSVFDQTVYAVALDGSGRVERLAHHRSNITDYEAYPFAVPSPDGKRVIIGSNWGASTGRPAQAYVIDTRRVCP